MDYDSSLPNNGVQCGGMRFWKYWGQHLLRRPTLSGAIRGCSKESHVWTISPTVLADQLAEDHFAASLLDYERARLERCCMFVYAT